jgi:hypothetical protein
VSVKLEPPEAERAEGFADHLDRAGLAGEDRPERDQGRLRPGPVGHRGVEVAGHSGEVAVAEADHALDAPREEELQHVGGLELIADGPGVGREPAPDRAKSPRREEVDVRVDHADAGWDRRSLRVVELGVGRAGWAQKTCRQTRT